MRELRITAALTVELSRVGGKDGIGQTAAG